VVPQSEESQLQDEQLEFALPNPKPSVLPEADDLIEEFLTRVSHVEGPQSQTGMTELQSSPGGTGSETRLRGGPLRDMIREQSSGNQSKQQGVSVFSPLLEGSPTGLYNEARMTTQSPLDEIARPLSSAGALLQAAQSMGRKTNTSQPGFAREGLPRSESHGSSTELNNARLLDTSGTPLAVRG
ncbi:unnamed protein product, partial [Amoebophrya sp. A25]